MVSKGPSNKKLLTEMRKNSKGILKNWGAIQENQKEIRKNGRRIDELLKLYFSLDKKVSVVEEKVVLFPEFFNKVDVLVGEITEGRQEKALMPSRIEDHEKRITTLESR
jgi:hypothetical protein